MTGPTPGPWGWEYHPVFAPRSLRPIALVAQDSDVIVFSGDEEGRAFGRANEDDLRLIAAAPAMLTALQFVAVHFGRLTEIWGQEGITKTVQDVVSEAIAEALGDNP